jgi:hypothetical protein
MGVAAGTAAAGTAVAAYLRSRKESRWQRAGKRASELASRIGTQATNPWASVVATAAIGLAQVAYANRAQILRQVRGISEQTGKLYPRVRRAIA